MEALAVVSQLRSLASQPEFRSTIVRDQGCLPGLLLFLDHSDPKIVAMALETLELLSECENNRTIMRQQTGMTPSLELILKKSNESLKVAARRVLNNILATPSHTAPGHGATLAAPSASTSASVKDKIAAINHSSASGASSSQPAFFAAGVNKKARTVVLQIEGLDDTQKKTLVEQKLVAVPGVISFTFDMRVARVTIRAKMDIRVDRLCMAVASTKIMAARQVIKNEHGEEVLLDVLAKAPVSSSLSASSTATDANGATSAAESTAAATGAPVAVSDAAAGPAPLKTAYVPAYLPEDDEQENTDNSRTALARVNDPKNSKSVPTTGGWWSTVGGYISKSLYW